MTVDQITLNNGTVIGFGYHQDGSPNFNSFQIETEDECVVIEGSIDKNVLETEEGFFNTYTSRLQVVLLDDVAGNDSKTEYSDYNNDEDEGEVNNGEADNGEVDNGDDLYNPELDLDTPLVQMSPAKLVSFWASLHSGKIPFCVGG